MLLLVVGDDAVEVEQQGFRHIASAVPHALISLKDTQTAGETWRRPGRPGACNHLRLGVLELHRRLPPSAAPSGVVAGRLVRLVQQLDRMAGLGGYTGGGEGGAELHEAAGVSGCDDLRGRVAQRRKLRHEHGA